MIACPITDVASRLPHSGQMVLLDEIIQIDAQGLQARAVIGADHVFLREDGTVPAWLAVEIMAQGIAAFDGCHAAEAGQGPRLGFLLGSRRLHLHADAFPVGAQLLVEVRISTSDGQGFGVFDCRLDWQNAPGAVRACLPQGRVAAEGALNVYQPPEGLQTPSIHHV